MLLTTWAKTGNPYSTGKLCTVDLLVLTSSDSACFVITHILNLFQTSYLDEEVNRTEPSASVSVPWYYLHNHFNRGKDLQSFKLEEKVKFKYVIQDSIFKWLFVRVACFGRRKK
jgi:hypothetical protein